MNILAKTLLLSILTSKFATIIVVVGGGFIAGGFGAVDFVWIFCVAILPIGLSCFALGAISHRLRKSEWAKWSAAILTGFIAVSFACAVMAPIVQSIQVGADRVNVSGYILWAPIYGLFLLPLSAPLAYWIIQLLGSWKNQFH